MSFLKKLFGGRPETPKGPDGEEDYQGFVIRATLLSERGEYTLAGEIEKEVGGETKTHRFIRADRFTDKDAAVAAALRKGRQLIDEQGEKVFG